MTEKREACEYCDREDGVLYAWHGDTWCRSCIERYPHLEMTGSLDAAPVGRPENATYSQPFIVQTGRANLDAESQVGAHETRTT